MSLLNIFIGVAGMTKTGCSETQRQILGVRIQVNYITVKSKMLSIQRKRERQGSNHKHFQLRRIHLAVFHTHSVRVPRRCFRDTEIRFPPLMG